MVGNSRVKRAGVPVITRLRAVSGQGRSAHRWAGSVAVGACWVSDVVLDLCLPVSLKATRQFKSGVTSVCAQARGSLCGLCDSGRCFDKMQDDA